jgi:hypothetical protein
MESLSDPRWLAAYRGMQDSPMPMALTPQERIAGAQVPGGPTAEERRRGVTVRGGLDPWEKMRGVKVPGGPTQEERLRGVKRRGGRSPMEVFEQTMPPDLFSPRVRVHDRFSYAGPPRGLPEETLDPETRLPEVDFGATSADAPTSPQFRSDAASRGLRAIPGSEDTETRPDPVVATGHADAVAWLERCSPKALERMRGASEAYQRRGADYAAHTAFGCRRAFEALADAFCPASEPKPDRRGVERELGERQFMNRVLRFVDHCKVSDGSYVLIGRDIEWLAKRFDALRGKLEKGVHHDPTGEDAWLIHQISWNAIALLARVAARA